jgi:hypothetical protein
MLLRDRFRLGCATRARQVSGLFRTPGSPAAIEIDGAQLRECTGLPVHEPGIASDNPRTLERELGDGEI